MNTTPLSTGTVKPDETLPDDYLNEIEFCNRYNIRPRTAQRWRVTGDGPPFLRLGPRRIAYRLRDCEGWAAARTFRHRADELASTMTT
jgi:hypothetical protein